MLFAWIGFSFLADVVPRSLSPLPCCALRFVLTPLPPRYWLKAKTLPPEMEATLTAPNGKVVLGGSKDPAVEGLAKTLSKVSSRVCQVARHRMGKSS